MPEYVRVAEFEASDEAVDALLAEIGSSDGPPEGVPATGITVLRNRAAGTLRVVVRFGSEADLATGSATLDSMTPPAGDAMRRTRVDAFEVALDRKK